MPYRRRRGGRYHPCPYKARTERKTSPRIELISKAIVLTGDGLNKRHKQLNEIVNEAVKNNIIFDEVKELPEKSDPDRLFKIDLAAKQRNIEYLLETLKCGDSLYITRVLNKIWLFEDSYSNFFNPEYLEEHIFPLMSLHMKKKTLSSILKNLKSEVRAAIFYDYCLKQKREEMALKFLLLTSESFKLNNCEKTFKRGESYSKLFIGSSLLLFNEYLETSPNDDRRFDLILRFHHMYSVDKDKYINLIENNVNWLERYQRKFGLRMSNDIMRKYKVNVLKHPQMYLALINDKIVVRNINSMEAKEILKKLMPSKACDFWEFYSQYNYILNIVPFELRYAFVKEQFTAKYPSVEFDLSEEFYEHACYEMMSVAEKEDWALRHVDSKKEILGHGNDYMWYKYVNFTKAFEEIKKYILITPDMDTRRDMINLLVERAKNQSDLEVLLTHYHARHVNEAVENKQRFLGEVINHHIAVTFKDECWNAFNLLLYSIEVYNNTEYCGNVIYRDIALAYHILHNIELPEILMTHALHHFKPYRINSLKLNDKQKDILLKFFLQQHLDQIPPYEEIDCNTYVHSVKEHISFILHLLKSFDKLNECPEIVKQYMRLDQYAYHGNDNNEPDCHSPAFNQRYLLKLLKTDAGRAITGISKIKTRLTNSYYTKNNFRMNELLRKLKIYFSNDISRSFLSFCLDLLTDGTCSKPQVLAGLAGIFRLADEDNILDFVSTYAPKEPKIQHDQIDETTWYIQEGICRYACYSRKAVPLDMMLKYMKGDYLKYCLPMFNYYMAHLPLPKSMEFIEALLKCPLSVQKHGVRLAFRGFSLENLTKLIKLVWKRSKNVSMRMILYKSLQSKIISEEPNDELFELFLNMTMDIHEEDHKDVFNVMTTSTIHDSQMPKYLETVWTILDKMPERNVFLNYRACAIRRITNMAITKVREEIILPIIIDHVRATLLDKGPFKPNGELPKTLSSKDEYHFKDLINSKWNLTITYIVQFDDERRMKINLELIDLIMTRCLDQWNQVDREEYTVQLFLRHFIKELQKEQSNYDCYSIMVNPIFEAVLTHLHRKLPIRQIYLLIWDLRITVLFRKVIYEALKDQSGHVTLEIKLDIASKLATEVLDIVNKFRERNEYFAFFVTDISNIIKNSLHKINALGHNEDVMPYFTEILTNKEDYDIYVLTLHIISTYPESYMKILQKISKFDNEEVKAIIYEKFVSKDTEFLKLNV